MKRFFLLCAAALLVAVIGCMENDPSKINNPGIVGQAPEGGAPAKQGINSGTMKTKGDMGGGNFAKKGGGGFAKKGGQAFPAGKTSMRPDQVPEGYPQPEGATVLTREGRQFVTKDSNGKTEGDAEKPNGDDHAKPDGEQPSKKADGEPDRTVATVKFSEKELENIAKLAPADQKLALVQGVCLIGEGNLGSMGKPVRVEHQGKVGFLCCAGCKAEFEADPSKAFAKVNKE